MCAPISSTLGRFALNHACRTFLVAAVTTTVSLGLIGSRSTPAAEKWQSHAPARPLPQPFARLLAEGPAYYVDGASGDDAAAGSKERPWRTIACGVAKLRPGDTLVVRGGTYHEHIRATLQGTKEKPITIRSAPDELAVIDGGMKEFLYEHATAWEPCPASAGGVEGEYRSTKSYAGLEQLEGDLHVSLLANFADSMTPLHGYWNRGDLQSDNPYFNLNEDADATQPAAKPKSAPAAVMPDKGFPKDALPPAKAKQVPGKTDKEKHVYCGPGIWYDAATGRIHCRLAHTKLSGLGDDNYRGETDPRKTPLIIAPWSSGSTMKLSRSRHVLLQDLVMRGARQPVLWLDGGNDLSIDGLHLYGGQSPIKVEGVEIFHMSHCACRGLAAPWTFRGSLKYRSIESRLFTTGGWSPSGADGRSFDISYSEFTDSVDGVFIGNVNEVFLQHNLFENISDDGVFLTATTGYDGKTPGGPHFILRNRFARILTTFAFGVGHGRQKIIQDAVPPEKWGNKQLGVGAMIHENIFDFRRPVHYYWPTGPDAPQEITSLGRFAGDHGSPGWEKMDIFNNTIIAGDPPRYEYGTDGFSKGMASRTKRRVVHNLIYQLNGMPGQTLPSGTPTFECRYNLFWSADEGALYTTKDWCEKFRNSPEQPKHPHWTTGDLFVDPMFESITADWRTPVDLRLKKGSPAINAGLSPKDKSSIDVVSTYTGMRDVAPLSSSRIDMGALQYGQKVQAVGCRGRIDICGNKIERATEFPLPEEQNIRIGFGPAQSEIDPTIAKPAAIVTGYPAFDAPLAAYALRRYGLQVEEFEKAWLDPREYHKYSVVVVDGSFVRAGLKTTQYADDELPIVRQFLDDGGTLWLCRERTDLFASDAGRKLLEELIGPQLRDNSKDFSVRLPKHPWVEHLAEPSVDLGFVAAGGTAPGWSKGSAIIGTSSNRALLGRVPVGKGRMIYLGWSPAAALPSGRVPSTVADEARFEAQMKVMMNIAAEIVEPAK
ncbi:MAG: hypothetical protein K8U03_24505 [Planctomycetia bacterium]|nr:hypothetical protein [Planctomycetia bacterium]